MQGHSDALSFLIGMVIISISRINAHEVGHTIILAIIGGIVTWGTQKVLNLISKNKK